MEAKNSVMSQPMLSATKQAHDYTCNQQKAAAATFWGDGVCKRLGYAREDSCGMIYDTHQADIMLNHLLAGW